MDRAVKDDLIAALEQWLTEHPVLHRAENGEAQAMMDDRGQPIALIAAQVHRELRELRRFDAVEVK